MTIALLTCGVCKASLEPVNTLGAPVLCPGCGAETSMAVFPALFEFPAEGRRPEAILLESESPCFYHTQKRAVAVCDGCGRFLCALCEIELNGRRLCPQCVETGVRDRSMTEFETKRIRYDTLAMTVAVIPIPIFYFTLFTAPIAIFIALRYWNAPPSIRGAYVTRIRMVMAILIALGQVAIWIMLALYAVRTLW